MNQGFDIRAQKGLSESEAAERLRTDGPNELPSDRRRTIFNVLWDVVREPMLLLLVCGGLLYMFLGDYQEALMLSSFVLVVIGITLYQERKTERALEALKDLSSPRALVIRDGQERRIPGREVVRGDIMVLAEGDRVPADARLLFSANLKVDESLLTGESVAVRKHAADDEGQMPNPGGDDTPFVFSGTLVVAGRGVAQVLTTGKGTALGRIGEALKNLEPEQTTLQKETGRLVKRLALAGLGLCAAVVVLFGATRGDWIQGLLAGITLAMATMPEEFPVVLTIFLALGAWRISHKRVLTRKMAAVETLGAATVLCVDKTGTLTQNRMTVSRLWVPDETFTVADGKVCADDLPEQFHCLAEYSILASQEDPFDPMEMAIHKMGADCLAHTEHLHADWVLEHEYPLCKDLLAMSHVWRSPNGQEFTIAAKGAPEAIIDLCHLDEARSLKVSAAVQQLASLGLRVLGVAKSHFKLGGLPEGQHDFDFQFLGLVALCDPIRPSVPDAVRECREAGIRVVMITGDYSATAQQIGREIGLQHVEQFTTGQELDQLAQPELLRRVGTCNIFCRVQPHQKLRLVQALKAAGEVVAMTGDGVNDAPAIKAAHIGIAMGARGTDVARESAGLVLLDDDFASIVAAVRMGRRIFDNIRKAMAYILAIHVPIAGMSLFPLLFGWQLKDLLLMPVHIMFLELIIDPSCSVIFEMEPEEKGLMNRPPRDPAQPLFSGRLLAVSLLQGLVVLAINMGVFALDRFLFGHSEEEARALTFVTLVLSNLALILTNRSWSRSLVASLRVRNSAVLWVFSGAFLFLGLAVFTPFLQDVFHFGPLKATDLLLALGGAALGVAWFEGYKVWARKSL